ncbi:S-adenosyl-L-methionine-dependent methyltransferase [Cladochytrium replicatum]|nr:S-adenosyl-L-methionine-dependent methyltransferase [Cladochytrium replicatum]
MSIHQGALQFNKEVDTYEAGRPTYPPDVVTCVLNQINSVVASSSHVPPVVVDLAAGTGKFTRLLSAVLPKSIDFIAVEPSPSMRAKFVELVPHVPMQEGTAGSLPFSDSSLSAITVAQAFHWFSTEEALNEFERVLEKGGILVLIWNLDHPTGNAPWVQKLRDIYAQHDNDVPQYRTGKWEEVFTQSELGKSRWTRVGREYFYHFPARTEEEIVASVMSKSYIMKHPEDVQANIRANIHTILSGPDVNWKVDAKGRRVVEFPYRTEVVWFTPAQKA